MDLYDQLPSSRIVHQPEFKFLLDIATLNGITCLDFLTQSPANLLKTLSRSINEITKFQEALRQEFEDEFINTKLEDINTVEKPLHFTTGNHQLDELLNGGVYTKGITEIFGESSTGKSQLLLQLALTVQLPKDRGGLDGQCVYITTEGDLPTKRLDHLITQSQLFKDDDGLVIVSQKKIFTTSCCDWANQDHISRVQLPILLERHPSIRLVIIDSISHHLRVELESTSFRESRENRSIIDKMAENLLNLAHKHNVAIVVANQVGNKLVPEKPIKQDFRDYDYQLGWFIGWKNSSIYYRHKFNELDFTDENLLSDDEEYSLVMDQLSQKQKIKNSQNPMSSSVTSSSNGSVNCQTKSKSSPKSDLSSYMTSRRKRPIDTVAPNLGLTWANHLLTRIKLEKWYKASPMIKSGDFDLNKMTDTSNFWQVRRNLKVVFSQYAPKNEMNYAITGEGIVSIE